jgi:poly-gamma-glutamate synthesis protein (capsule biosynthesis protein)
MVMARLAFVGDVMLGRLVSERLRAGLKAEQCWGDVAPLLQAADGVIANLECALTTSRERWLRTPKAFHFRADPKAIDVLKAGNIRAVCLANNHVLDFEVTGLIDTLRRLDQAGIAHAGAGIDRAQAQAAVHFSCADLKIALLAVTDDEPGFAAGVASPGTAYVELGSGGAELGPTAEQIRALRADGAGLIVLSSHLGPNMVQEPSAQIRSYRHACVRHGVDIVHGHSAHLVQGVEQQGKALIFHDTGDILDDYAVDPIYRNDWSFVFFLELEGAVIRRLTLCPVELALAQVRQARAGVADAICARMLTQCAGLGTRLTRVAEGLDLNLAS